MYTMLAFGDNDLCATCFSVGTKARAELQPVTATVASPSSVPEQDREEVGI